MVLGTVQVKQQLGSEYPTTEKEIQDALWHYFFDVGKAVTYIKSRRPLGSMAREIILMDASDLRKPVETKAKTKPVSKFDQVASAAAKKDISSITGTHYVFLSLWAQHLHIVHFLYMRHRFFVS